MMPHRSLSTPLLALALLLGLAPAADAETLMPTAPSIAARNWILVDFASGQTLAESQADQKSNPPASPS